MSKRITTLFVRDDSINVAVIDEQTVHKWATASIEPGLVTNGLVTDDAKVAAAIREVLKENGIRGGKVVAAVSGINSLYRMITLPEMPDALLGEAIRREAQRVLPISLDEVYLSHQTVPSVSKGERKMFLATYPKNTTDAMVRTIRMAGLDPYLMDLEPLALSRVPNEPRSLIIHARAQHADIVVIEERLPQLIRVLSLPAEAESLEDKLPAICEELNRTVVFYNSSHAENPINNTVPLFVCGELAEHQEAWPQLAGRMEFNVAPLPAPMQGPPEFQPNDFMVNIGLALKEVAVETEGSNFSTVNLNILPGVRKSRRISVTWVAAPAAGVIGIAALAYMGSFAYRGAQDVKQLRSDVAASEPAIVQQTQRIADLKKQVTDLQPQAAPIEAQTAQVRATAAALGTFASGLDANRQKVTVDLKGRVFELLPFNKENLSLTTVGHDGTSIVINGTANDETRILAYARALRDSGGITATVITTITAEDESHYSFSLLLK